MKKIYGILIGAGIVVCLYVGLAYASQFGWERSDLPDQNNGITYTYLKGQWLYNDASTNLNIITISTSGTAGAGRVIINGENNIATLSTLTVTGNVVVGSLSGKTTIGSFVGGIASQGFTNSGFISCVTSYSYTSAGDIILFSPAYTVPPAISVTAIKAWSQPTTYTPLVTYLSTTSATIRCSYTVSTAFQCAESPTGSVTLSVVVFGK